MKNLICLFIAILHGTLFAQTPSITLSEIDLDVSVRYNNWNNQNDTFFVVPVKMDSFFSGVDSFAFNITYDAQYLEPIMNLTDVNDPGFILLMNYLGGAEFAMVDTQTIQTDTFDMSMSNTDYMLSVSYKQDSTFTKGMYDNCLGTLMYIAFKRKDICAGGVFPFEFTDGLIGSVYLNPNQPNTCLLAGSQVYSADSSTLTANNGYASKQNIDVTIAQNGPTLEGTAIYGFAPYQFTWSSGETTQNITPALSGDYFLLVSDAMGCLDTSATYNFTYTVGTNPVNGHAISVSPNPFSSNLTIRALGEIIAIVYSLDGKKLKTAFGKNEVLIEKGDLAKGVYLLKTSVNSNIFYHNIVVY